MTNPPPPADDLVERLTEWEEVITDFLAHPGWRPNRAHIEAARNKARQAASEIARLRQKLEDAEEERNKFHAAAWLADEERTLAQSQRDALAKAAEPFVEIARELAASLADDHKNTMHWAVPSVGAFRALASARARAQAIEEKKPCPHTLWSGSGPDRFCLACGHPNNFGAQS